MWLRRKNQFFKIKIKNKKGIISEMCLKYLKFMQLICSFTVHRTVPLISRHFETKSFKYLFIGWTRFLILIELQ